MSVSGVREFCGRAEVGLGRWAGRGQAVGKARESRGPCDAAATCNGQSADHAYAASAEAGPEAGTAGDMDMDMAAKTAKTCSAALLLLLCAPPLGERRARRSAWRVAAGRHPSRSIHTTRHDTTRHNTHAPTC
jgi:hypothetical protein